MISADEIAAFKQEMSDAQADVTFVAYDGAKHGFSNPEATERGEKFGTPVGYDRAADQQSWAAMTEFLADCFGRVSANDQAA